MKNSPTLEEKVGALLSKLTHHPIDLTETLVAEDVLLILNEYAMNGRMTQKDDKVFYDTVIRDSEMWEIIPDVTKPRTYPKYIDELSPASFAVHTGLKKNDAETVHLYTQEGKLIMIDDDAKTVDRLQGGDKGTIFPASPGYGEEEIYVKVMDVDYRDEIVELLTDAGIEFDDVDMDMAISEYRENDMSEYREADVSGRTEYDYYPDRIDDMEKIEELIEEDFAREERYSCWGR